MHRAGAVAVLVILAGCAGSDEGSKGSEGPAPAEGADPTGNFSAEWSGTMAASGAVELPAHWAETAPVAHQVWPDVARDFVISKNASQLVVRLEWTGTGLVQLMANSPMAGGAMTEYSAPGPQQLSQTSPLCVRVAGDDLAPGGWEIMLHTMASVDIAFTFNVTVVGEAEGPLPDGSAWDITAGQWAQMQAAGTMGEVAAPC